MSYFNQNVCREILLNYAGFRHHENLLQMHVYVDINGQLDVTDCFFITDLIVCSTCFGHRYAHHQEL